LLLRAVTLAIDRRSQLGLNSHVQTRNEGRSMNSPTRSSRTTGVRSHQRAERLASIKDTEFEPIPEFAGPEALALHRSKLAEFRVLAMTAFTVLGKSKSELINAAGELMPVSDGDCPGPEMLFNTLCGAENMARLLLHFTQAAKFRYEAALANALLAPRH
jgi:hypothetical protein